MGFKVYHPPLFLLGYSLLLTLLILIDLYHRQNRKANFIPM